MGRPRKHPLPEKADELGDELKDELAAPDALDQIQALLRTVSPGYRIQVWRQAPREFRGLLEEIEVTDGTTPLDLEYLARTWGGKELRIKIRNKKGQYKGTYDIPLYSHPPLFWGKPIPTYTPPAYAEPPQAYPRLHGDNAPAYPPPYPSYPTAPPAPPILGAGATLAELLGVLQKYKSTESELLSSLLARTASSPLPAPTPSPFEALNQAIELIARLQSMSPPPAAPPVSLGSSDSDSLVPHITRLIEMFLSRQTEAERQTHPRPGPSPTPTPTRTPTPTPTPINGNDIIASLANSDPRDLASVYQGVLAELPRDKRLRAIEAFEAAFETVEPGLYTDEPEEPETEESEKPGIG